MSPPNSPTIFLVTDSPTYALIGGIAHELRNIDKAKDQRADSRSLSRFLTEDISTAIGGMTPYMPEGTAVTPSINVADLKSAIKRG